MRLQKLSQRSSYQAYIDGIKHKLMYVGEFKNYNFCSVLFQNIQ